MTWASPVVQLPAVRQVEISLTLMLAIARLSGDSKVRHGATHLGFSRPCWTCVSLQRRVVESMFRRRLSSTDNAVVRGSYCERRLSDRCRSIRLVSFASVSCLDDCGAVKTAIACAAPRQESLCEILQRWFRCDAVTAHPEDWLCIRYVFFPSNLQTFVELLLAVTGATSFC